MSPLSTVIHGRSRGHLWFVAHQAFVDFGHAGPAPGPWTAETADTASSAAAPVAFVGLIDLVRSRASDDSGEICEECKTLNRPRACYCKGCAHKLPAYYACTNARAPMALRVRRERTDARTLAWDLAAVWVVLSSLVLITAFIPVG
ncbi:MAG: hypothetical protein J7549_18000 [Variovorax sp.]|nr:hypothetical protein [Variovorax sp.]